MDEPERKRFEEWREGARGIEEEKIDRHDLVLFYFLIFSASSSVSSYNEPHIFPSEAYYFFHASLMR